MKLEEVDGYAAARAEYDGAVVAAKAQNDETAELRAELNWRNRLDGFRDTLASRERHLVAVEAARAEAREKWARAPEAAWAHLDDPDAIRQVAQSVHDQIAAAIPTTPQRPQPTPAQPWPTPPAGGQAPPPGHKFDDVNTWNENLNNWRMEVGKSGLGMNHPRFKEMRDFVLERLAQATPNQRG